MIRFHDFSVQPFGRHDLPTLFEILDLCHPDAAVFWDRDVGQLSSEISHVSKFVGQLYSVGVICEIVCHDNTVYVFLQHGLSWIVTHSDKIRTVEWPWSGEGPQIT